MLNMNTSLPVIPVTADAATGRVAVTSPAEFSLNSLLDGSKTVRSHPTAGSITIAHQSTKELGGASRHLTRRDVPANGDHSPSSAQLVIVAQDTAAGRVSGLKAAAELIAACITAQGYPAADDLQNLQEVTVSDDGKLHLRNYDDVFVIVDLAPVLSRVLNGEG